MLVAAILGVLLAVFMSGFFSGTETGLYCVDRLRLRVDAQRGDRRATRLARLVDHQRDALATLLVGNNLANYVATALVAQALISATDISTGASELYTAAIVTPIIFVFGEIIPKTLFQRHADTLMRSSSGLLTLSRTIFHLPVLGLARISQPIIRLLDPRGLSDAPDARSRVVVLLQEALASADATGDHRAFVDRVLGLSQVAIHQIMVPRNRVVSLRADATRADLEALVRKHAHSRLLIHDRSPRRATGYITVHELLADTKWTQVGQRAQRVCELAAHDSVAAALVRLQRERETLAAVVDRGGNLLGLVTRKDLLEELTGELPEW